MRTPHCIRDDRVIDLENHRRRKNAKIGGAELVTSRERTPTLAAHPQGRTCQSLYIDDAPRPPAKCVETTAQSLPITFALVDTNGLDEPTQAHVFSSLGCTNHIRWEGGGGQTTLFTGMRHVRRRRQLRRREVLRGLGLVRHCKRTPQPCLGASAACAAVAWGEELPAIARARQYPTGLMLVLVDPFLD